MLGNIVSQSQSSTFGQNYPTLQRGLFAIGKLVVRYVTGGKKRTVNKLKEDIFYLLLPSNKYN